ncbi:MAG: hypothetical protein AAGC69_23450 [Paracraurococcus sp.]
MKKWIAEALLRILWLILRQVIERILLWLLEAIDEHMRRRNEDSQRRSRAEEEGARRDRERARATGNHGAAQEAAARAARARRDAEMMRKATTVVSEILRDVAAELPKAVDTAIESATKGGATQMLQAIEDKSERPPLLGPAAT